MYNSMRKNNFKTNPVAVGTLFELQLFEKGEKKDAMKLGNLFLKKPYHQLHVMQESEIVENEHNDRWDNVFQYTFLSATVIQSF